MKIRDVFGKRDLTEFVYGNTGSRTMYIENLYYLHNEVSMKVCASKSIVYFRCFSWTAETRTTLNAEQESVFPKHSRDTQWRWNVYHNNNLVKLNVIVHVWVKQLFVQHTLYYIQLLENPRERTSNHLANNNAYISRRILSQNLQLQQAIILTLYYTVDSVCVSVHII